MKAAYRVAIVISFMLVTVSSANAQFFSGNNLNEEWEAHVRCTKGAAVGGDFQNASFYAGYVAGVYDATNSLINAPSNVALGQACKIVGKYLDDHPEKLNEPAWFLVFLALEEAFPKSKE